MKYNIGIDIGMRNIRMAVEGYGIAFSASSAVAVQKGADLPVAFGDEALGMLGRMYEGGSVEFPVASGVCEDEGLLIRWLTALFERARSIAKLRRIHAVLSVAPDLQRPHQYAFMQAALEAGADSVALVRQDALGAIGAGLDVMQPEGSFVIDVGAGGMGAAIFAFGRTVASQRAMHGLAGVDAAIVQAVRAKGVRIGEKSAEAAKLALASANEAGASLNYSVAGFDAVTGFPRMVEIDSQLVNSAVSPLVREIAFLAEGTLAKAPVELAADLAEKGACLIGGGASLFSLDVLLQEALGIPVRAAEDPAQCVARGLAAFIEDSEKYDRLILDQAGRAER